eukprot:gene6782-6999_t
MAGDGEDAAGTSSAGSGSGARHARRPHMDKGFKRLLKRVLTGFMADSRQRELAFPASLSAGDRYAIHVAAEAWGLGHASHNEGSDRIIKWQGPLCMTTGTTASNAEGTEEVLSLGSDDEEVPMASKGAQGGQRADGSKMRTDVSRTRMSLVANLHSMVDMRNRSSILLSEVWEQDEADPEAPPGAHNPAASDAEADKQPGEFQPADAAVNLDASGAEHVFVGFIDLTATAAGQQRDARAGLLTSARDRAVFDQCDHSRNGSRGQDLALQPSVCAHLPPTGALVARCFGIQLQEEPGRSALKADAQ